MNLVLLHEGERPPTRFTRPPEVKNDTHYVFVNGPYTTEVVFHSSMFYAPDFFTVKVKNEKGEIVWSGGEAMFLDTLFLNNFLSDKYHRLVLTRVNSTQSPNHMQPLMVDLKTGRETLLDAEDFYVSAGHLMSTDAVYFNKNYNTQCIDFESRQSFSLTDLIKTHFQDIKTWGTCPVKNCVVVYTCNGQGMLSLFNLHKRKIEEQLTLPPSIAGNNITINPLHTDGALYISISQPNKESKTQPPKTVYARLSF